MLTLCKCGSDRYVVSCCFCKAYLYANLLHVWNFVVSNQAAKGDNGPAFLLPAAGTLQIALGYFIGKIMSLFMYGSAPEHASESKQFLIGTTFGNSGPLPLVFTDALFRTAPDATLLPRSVAFISLYLLGWSPLFWVVGNSFRLFDNHKLVCG